MSTLEEYGNCFASTEYIASNGAFGGTGILRSAFDDTRWQGTIIAVRSNKDELYLPVFLAETAQIKSTQLARSFQEAGYPISKWKRIALIGGVPGGLPGFLYHADMSPGNISMSLEYAVKAAAAWSRELGASLLALFADSHIAIACKQLDICAKIQPYDMRAVLAVKKQSDYPRRVRGVYAADLRQFARLGLSWQRLPWQEVLAVIGDLIVALKRRHGRDEVVRRLQEEMLDLESGGGVEILGVVIHDGDKQIMGGSLMWMYRDRLHVVETGMVDDPTYSREVYFAAVFHAPLEIAYEQGITTIDFGLSAPIPKRVRGAILEPSYLVVMSSGEYERPQ